MTTIIEQNRDKLIELCRKYHVTALDVFGSAATQEWISLSSFAGNIM